MSEFKVGDKVYCPHFSTWILTLVQSEKSEYLLAIDLPSKLIDITKAGKIFDAQGMVSDIVHATPENHKSLEKLYGIEFEKPPTPPTSKEIIQAMLDRGCEYTPCWVSDRRKNPTATCPWAFIGSASNDGFTDECGTTWRYATPFDPETVDPITELPE